MSKISRDPINLVRQTIGLHHQYPDGLMLFLGTMFAPIKDRGKKGNGFTHSIGDYVEISLQHIVIETEPKQDLEKNYLSQISGIAL